VALGAPVEARAEEGVAGEEVALQRRDAGGWRTVARAPAGEDGSVALRDPAPGRARRLQYRAVSGDAASAPVVVRTRLVTLAAVGDVNLGDGPGAAIAAYGAAWPWRYAGPVLRRADVALANLECAVSRRGVAQPKQFVFRGDPASLPAMRRVGGIDLVTLANNHAGDYGRTALLDTRAGLRAAGIGAFGAGADLAGARAPVVVRRLGLRIGFVGFSDIQPASFYAGPGRPGTSPADPAGIRAAVTAARRRADVVVAVIHWGIELQTLPDARQRQLAEAALAAGATAVIGHHPHVLQPRELVGGRRAVAWSLGNFVFSAGSPGTTSTGVLTLRLSAFGVEGMGFRPMRIVGTRPVPA
jgi:poly-gamma-glutamate capsule biosynthesis protein CapA/YwtB (metallophosphatase superfamily)